MKGRVSIERIATARQRLAELSELGSGPHGSQSQVQQAVDLLSGILDELETVANESDPEQEADNESRFHTLAETASDGILSIDDQSAIRYVNPAAGQMFGYEPCEMLNKSLTVLMPERFRQNHLTSFRRYLATGQKHIHWRAIELVGLHRSGREFPIEISFGEDVRRDKHFFTGIVRDVTERKRSEEALRVSEQRLQAIVDNTTALVFIKDLELRYVLVNREYERLFDIGRDQIRGKTDFDVHPHDVAETLRANDRQVIETGGPLQFEEVVPSRAGARHYVVVKFPLRDHVNEPYAICGIATDITERMRSARQAALHAEIHSAFSGLTAGDLQTILQLSAGAVVRHLDAAFARIWTLNDQGDALELQASAGQYTRLDGEHARVPVGQLKIGLIAHERKPHLTNDVQNDERISHPDWAKREGMVAFAGYPLVVEGHLFGVLAMFARKSLEPAVLQTLALVADTIAKGIERKWAEKKLQDSERNLRLFMETIPQMLWSATPDGAIDYYNQRVLDYAALSMDELRGAGWIKLIHPDERDAMTNAWMVAVAEGVSFKFEFRGRRGADGMYRWCVSSALPLRDREGRILRWYGSVVDLHDWKQAQESLRTREAELAHTTRIMTMGEITSSIAHEINQPLGAIVNYGNACLRLITTGSADLTDIAAALSEIVNDANRASSIIARIRALSKKDLPEMVVLEVADLIAEILPLVRYELNKRRIVLKTVLSDNLSPVVGDRIQLQQVLLNLVINGMDAMHQVPEDQRHLSIEAESHVSEEKSFVLITVTDSGIGLKAEDLPRLFETFYTTKAEGMGMGLAISRSIVEAHGGRLWAATNADFGATFRFILPAQTQRAGG
jgi:PAS domain S-box-containing protein